MQDEINSAQLHAEAAVRGIGAQMRRALAHILREPGVTDLTINREYGRTVTDRLIKRDLIIVKNGQFARNLYIQHNPQPKTQTEQSVKEASILKKAYETVNSSDLGISVVCPSCHAQVGQPCTSHRNNEPCSAHYQRLVMILYIIIEHDPRLLDPKNHH
jgi:hypothetical protein